MRLGDHPNAQLFIHRLKTHSTLTTDDAIAILNLPAQQYYSPAKRVLEAYGSAAEYSRFIVDGLAATFTQVRNGKRQFTAFHIAGDVADLHAALHADRWSELYSISDVVFLEVPHTAIRALAAQRSDVAEAFWRDCMLDAAVVRQWLINVGRRDARTKLAHVLCEMAVRYGKNRDPLLVYRFPVTQDQLADATAMTGIHVNRSLRGLAREGLVTMAEGVVRIPDWNRLVGAAEFDRDYLDGCSNYAIGTKHGAGQRARELTVTG